MMKLDHRQKMALRYAFWDRLYQCRKYGLDTDLIGDTYGQRAAEALAEKVLLELADRGHDVTPDTADQVVDQLEHRLAQRAKAAVDRAVARLESQGEAVPGVAGSLDRAFDALMGLHSGKAEA